MVDQIRKLCSMLKLKKYKSSVRNQLSLLIGQNQQLMVVTSAVQLPIVNAESKPNSHKAFSVVLADDKLSESTAAGKGSGKQGSIHAGEVVLADLEGEVHYATKQMKVLMKVKK
jgi:hypothetical protein